MNAAVWGKEFASGASKKIGKNIASNIANIVRVSHKKNGVEGCACETPQSALLPRWSARVVSPILAL